MEMPSSHRKNQIIHFFGLLGKKDNAILQEIVHVLLLPVSNGKLKKKGGGDTYNHILTTLEKHMRDRRIPRRTILPYSDSSFSYLSE